MATPIFTIQTGTVEYPAIEKKELVFGSDFAHSEYVIPMARFKFYTATGEESKARPIYIRLGGAFSTNLTNSYQKSTGIFGSVTPGQDMGKITELIGSMFDSGGTALQSSIIKSLGAGAGFISSAGQSGKSQIEFLTRKVFNSFQQLTYQGPEFRAFQLPFNMKPTSYEEAKTMRDIIQTFRIASSPRASGDTKLKEGSDTKSASEIEALADANKNKSPEEVATPFTLEAAEGVFGEGDNRTPLTFGYPDMCKFELILYRDDPEARQRDENDDITAITVLFKSDFCMIGNITIDYGASNKMVFLAPPTPTGGGKADYFPSEVNMTIALTESVLVTAEYASGQGPSGSGITIF
jgi:hypothetical protein